MIKGLYCVRDYKVGYTAVITDENDAVALRAIKLALTPDTIMYNNFYFPSLFLLLLVLPHYNNLLMYIQISPLIQI